MNRTMHEFEPDEVMAYLDGELHAARTLEVAAHLDKCADCGALVAELRSMSKKLAEWQIEPLPTSLDSAESVLARAQTDRMSRTASVAEKWIERIGREPWLWRFGMAGVGVCVIAFALFMLPKPNLLRAREATERASQIAAQRNFKLQDSVTSNEPVAESEGISRYAPQGIVGGTAPAPAPPPPNMGGGGGNRDELKTIAQQAEGPMIARTAALKIVVAKFGAARGAMEQILKRHKGYASQLTIASEDGSAPALDASLRVPSAEMEAALVELRALGRVENETQGGEDVSEQHVDLTARLHNALETEQRLIDILRQRTGKVSDVLEVEEQISQTRGEIEQMEAQLAGLDKRVEFASIDLHIAEEYKASSGVGMGSSAGLRLRNAVVGGYRAAVESMLAMAVFILNAGPTLLLWAALLFLPVRAIWRRRHAILRTSSGA